MSGKSHEGLVDRQFGPRAEAYVKSAVHAHGEDLDEIVALVTGHPHARVLDMGCGGGHVGLNVAPHVAEVVAYDLAPEMLQAVRTVAAERGIRNLTLQQGVAEKLPLDKASFDFVFSRYSAHHWHDLDAALREARRVLRPGGQAAFADAVSPGAALLDTHMQAIELLRDPSHARDYSTVEWIDALHQAGFTVKKLTHRKLRIEFASWIARMATPDAHAAAIRSLQAGACDEVTRHFQIERDGSWLMDTATIVAVPA